MQHFSTESLFDIMGELFSDEISIGITDKEKYIYFRPSKRIDLKIKAADIIKEGTLAHKALTSEQKISEYISRDIYGVPYHGMAAPIRDGGEVSGTVLAVYPTVTEGKSVITVRTEDGWKPLPFSEITYLEIKDRKTHIITESFQGTHNQTLQEFEYVLPKDIFIRCHRSFIANVHHIKTILPDTHSTFLLEMKNGEQIPVSQSYSSYFRKLLGF